MRGHAFAMYISLPLVSEAVTYTGHCFRTQRQHANFSGLFVNKSGLCVLVNVSTPLIFSVATTGYVAPTGAT